MTESSYLKALIDTINQFKILTSESVSNCGLVLRYCEQINEILEFLKPVFDDMLIREIALDDQLTKLLEEIKAFVDEARALSVSWNPMMSKVHFVLQMESVVTRIQESVLESLSLLMNSLYKSFEDDSGLNDVKQCVQKIQNMASIRISNIIREAMKDQTENKLLSPQHLLEIAESLSLTTNEELLIEAIALEKLRIKSGHEENQGEVEYIDHMIALVTHMHDSHVKKYRVQSINNVPVPADLCCSLSLEVMSDPVILASGQTCERVFIRKWLDQGIIFCPKTHQTLGHTKLIPNYTVKELIENWCNTNKIRLPDPLRADTLAHLDKGTSDSSANLVGIHPQSAPPNRPTIQQTLASLDGSYLEAQKIVKPISSQDSVCSLTSSPLMDGSDESIISKLPLANSDGKDSCLEEQHCHPGDQTSEQSKDSSLEGNEYLQGHNHSSSISVAVYNNENVHAGDDNGGKVHNNKNGVSGKMLLEIPSAPNITRKPEYLPRLGEFQSRIHTAWRRPSGSFSPRIISPHSHESRPDSAGIVTKVHKLIDDLNTGLIDVQRDATAELRLLSKHSTDNRIVIGNCGAIEVLVPLLHSLDTTIQKNAVTALLNLSITDDNKTAIANANCINPLIHVLKSGCPEAKENAAATLFNLSVIEENKLKIGRSGAIDHLVELLGNGTPQGKKDAATALFNLSIFHENKARIVKAGAVKHLIELMDPAAGMVGKAVKVLANLSTISEGRSAIGSEGGIPVLVEVVELGTAKEKEIAAAALLHLCTNSNKFCRIVLLESAVPPLVALSKFGTSRGKEKAQTLLRYLKDQRY